MRGSGAWAEVRAKCPYCEYATTLIARDIRGQSFVLECLDCRETYVVEVAVEVSHRVRALADVDKDEVLDRLTDKKGGDKAPPKPPAAPPAAAVGARATTAAGSGNRSRKQTPRSVQAREVQGHRYGPGARGES